MEGIGPLVVALQSVGPADAATVGTKAATLGGLVAAGFAVPEGRILTCAAFEAAIGRDDLPEEVAAAITSIAGHFGDATLAVRSSAVEEDAPDHSFAGQFETVLGVRGHDELRAAVARCWASAAGERVTAYRGGRSAAPLAVLVQRQVAADVAGVAFTADPVGGGRDGVHVSAAPGLGDAVVSGAVQPDEWVVRDGAATPLRAEHQALAAAQAEAVAELARRIESVQGTPQDIEWAMAGGRLVVLQARPITALPVAPRIRLPEGTWVKETERNPEPLTALGASVVAPLVARGLTAMTRESGGLIDRFEACPIGGEPYLKVVPLGGRGGPPPPWWVFAILSRVAPPLRRQMRRAKHLLRPGALAARQERWEQEWRPDVRRRVTELHDADLQALCDAQLAAHLDTVVAELDRCLEIHFRLTMPYLVAVHALVEAGAELGWPELRTMDLLAGLSTATSAPARALAEIADGIRANPRAGAALTGPGGDLAGDLRRADVSIGAAFDDWCRRYGRCCVNDDPGSPTLVELPWALAAQLRDAVRRAGEQAAERAAATRAAREAEARAALARRPAAERDRFDQVLAAARRVYPLREDSAFWTGSLPAGLVRTAAVEFGRRLVERGLLGRAEDAVNLPLDTLRASLAASEKTGLRAAAARAAAERAYVRANPGPAHYGPPPPPPPDLRGLPSAGRIVNEAMLFARRSQPAAPGGGDVVASGVAASAGNYTGPVCVVRGTADFGRLRAGDVLVCPTSDPAWSVLFGIAGALVTDGGGVLSHAAIVAREFAIPAVVGTGSATTDLRDGQVVTVAGTSGRVLRA